MSDAMNLIDQLRDPRHSVEPYKSLGDLCKEAADKIERLQNALNPFAKIAKDKRRQRPNINRTESVRVSYGLLRDVENILADEQSKEPT